jgi:Tol biopolymer transport system component
MCVALAAAILAAWLVVVLATPTKRAEAAFPGKNGKIAFMCVRGGYSEICTMNANGDNKTQLTNNNRVYDSNPVFSPDGKKIAFASDRSGTWDIFIMSANGTDLKRVTTSESNEAVPAWSPNGNKIAFARFPPRDLTWEIFVMKAAPESETNRPKRLTFTDGSDDVAPDWQPLR